MATKLLRIAQKAQREPDFKFTSLFHLMNEDLLRECFARLRKDAASGIDRVTKEDYGVHLEDNLRSLTERLQAMRYIPSAVRRVYIPKPGSDKKRPLGIPTLEDKLVQAAMTRILEQIYEHDFVDGSYGFRPGRSCHDALRDLNRTLDTRRIEWVVEADIKGFFDHVHHDMMKEFLGHRIGDTRMIRMVVRFLKAGVMEEGKLTEADEGTPQGGTISPLLANIYLHYALDLWFAKPFRRSCQGVARLIRYADDFVACFSDEKDARRYRTFLDERLGKFGLEIEASKTRVLAFGPRTLRQAEQEGRKPETFDFLGFTHYCSRARDGKRFRVKRRTARKKFRAKLAGLKEWLRANRNTLRTRELWEQFRKKLQGHFAYYGVTDNYKPMADFLYQARRLLKSWLNRRGGNRRFTWKKFELMEKRFPFPRPRIRVDLITVPGKTPAQGYLFP